MQLLARDAVRLLIPIMVVALCLTNGGRSERGAAIAPRAESTAVITRIDNSAPSISGQAGANARVGAPYEFQPTVSNPDRDALTFSAANLPPWAKLDPKTGRVVGTPNAGDVGAYESIVISAVDATHTVSTSEFEITVLPAPTGIASLRWDIPASKVDGSPLDNLAGYRILYGRDPQDLDHSVFVDGASVNSYEIADLEAGVWYFAVAAVNENGLESPPSTAFMKSI
jgi:hypothetical protein